MSQEIYLMMIEYVDIVTDKISKLNEKCIDFGGFLSIVPIFWS